MLGGMNPIVAIVIAVIGLTIIADVLQTNLLGQSYLGSFTGLGPVARLLPLAIVGAIIYKGYYAFSGGRRGM